MRLTKRENTTELQKIMQEQLQSLFIGTVINGTDLVNYARTKNLINFHGGYDGKEFDCIQWNMNEVKRLFPNVYASYRVELMAQIQGRNFSSIFNICDKYIRSFSGIRSYTHTEVNKHFKDFSSRLAA